MKAIIIDDDINMHALLSSMLQRLQLDVEVVGTATNVAAGVQLIEETDPELIFLDIDLPDGTGFDILEHFDHTNFTVIFISGHNEYGNRVVKFSALAYLYKPLRPAELREAVAEAIESREKEEDYEGRLKAAVKNIGKQTLPSIFTVKNSDGIHFIPVNEIRYLRGVKDAVTVVWSGGKAVPKSASLQHFEEQFDPYLAFKRVNKNYLLNLRFVRKEISGPYLVLDNGEEIKISYAMAREVRDLLDRL